MQNYLISGGIALLVALAVAVGLHPVVTQGPPGPPGQPGTTLGSGGPDIGFPWIRFGGVLQYGGSMTMKTATTTVCAIQSPSATSTLVWGTARFDTSSSTATQLYMVKTTASSGTTTNATMLAYTTAAANQIGVTLGTVASSTAGGAALAGNIAGGYIFAPNTWLNVAMAGGIGTFSPTGECKANWKVL